MVEASIVALVSVGAAADGADPIGQVIAMCQDCIFLYVYILVYYTYMYIYLLISIHTYAYIYIYISYFPICSVVEKYVMTRPFGSISGKLDKTLIDFIFIQFHWKSIELIEFNAIL